MQSFRGRISKFILKRIRKINDKGKEMSADRLCEDAMKAPGQDARRVQREMGKAVGAGNPTGFSGGPPMGESVPARSCEPLTWRVKAGGEKNQARARREGGKKSDFHIYYHVTENWQKRR